MNAAQSVPRITLISRSDSLGRSTYRLDGGTVAAGWLRPGKEAWCEVTLYDVCRREDGWYLTSFGGEVWPAAWPALFESGRGTAQTGPWTRLTSAGIAAFRSAR